jgi:hypothetical protein
LTGAEGASIETPLRQPLELVERDSELSEDLEEEGRPDFPSSVDRNGDGTPVGMVPP